GLLARLYFRAEVYGIENIPDPPYIIAPNHCSSMDQTVVSWAIGKKRRKDLYTLATKFFFDNPFARFFMKIDANVVRIDPTEEFMAALQAACKVIKLRKSIYINPEGTRSATGELLPFKPGVGVVAVETGAPIVPVYIDGTFEALPTGSIFPKPHKVRVFFGEPVNVREFVKKQETEKAYDVYRTVTDEVYNRVLALKKKAKS
ncbi:lysophospholipid acyltransferase family protein, partial [Candidatus Margulisiibacteriota bacterium]